MRSRESWLSPDEARVPREKRRSSRYCTTLKTEVSTRYHSETVNRSSMMARLLE